MSKLLIDVVLARWTMDNGDMMEYAVQSAVDPIRFAAVAGHYDATILSTDEIELAERGQRGQLESRNRHE